MEFTQSMTKEQVKETLEIKEFSKPEAGDAPFFKCNSSKKLIQVNLDGFPTGEEVPSKESMYMVEGRPDVEQVSLLC